MNAEIKFNVENLAEELEEALQHYLDYSNETVMRFSDDDRLKELARFASEDTYRCLSEFREAIVNALSK